ncbi:hypothetical protein HK098_003710 [Nowakowskiella sp. JEL0407]|nr:hypothetical protein HK098_003710 [Nowakowskiella sp. JEL0407]
MSHKDFTPWNETDIAQKRLEWHKFISQDFPNKYPTFSNAAWKYGMKGRGIIFTTTSNSMYFLLTSITILRRHGCHLPIEVWYFKVELNSTHISAINSLNNLGGSVKLRQVDDPDIYLPIKRGTALGAGSTSPGQAPRNFHVKVAAVINSGFRHVLSLDADIMSVRNPEYLFDELEYKEDGAIFWPDFWKTAVANPVWSWMGISCVDEWEQESGMLVIDKKKSWKALHLSWFMNRNDEIRYWRRFIHGDKDTFRFAWRATGTRFMYVQSWLSPGGFEQNTTSGSKFCGNSMIQHDLRGRVLFLHTNLFKELHWSDFNETRLPLTHVKRYKNDPRLDKVSPPGPIPGSLLSYFHTRGYKARFTKIEGLKNGCTDLYQTRSGGISRYTHVFHLEDPKVPGAPKKGFLLEMFRTMSKFRLVFDPPAPPLKVVDAVNLDKVKTPSGAFRYKQTVQRNNRLGYESKMLKKAAQKQLSESSGKSDSALESSKEEDKKVDVRLTKNDKFSAG